VAGYLQIRLGDIHERLPRVETLVNKGIVIARQIQSLEQRFEGRHKRAEIPRVNQIRALRKTERVFDGGGT
jgi:hypothetical protein